MIAYISQNIPGRVSLTFDGWTTSIMTAYIAVTAHSISDKWELVSGLLSFKLLSGSHSGENQAQLLYDLAWEHGIQDKVRSSPASLQIVVNTQLADESHVGQRLHK